MPLLAGSESSVTGAIALNVLANALWAAIVFGGRRIIVQLDPKNPRQRRIAILCLIGAIGVVLLGCLWAITIFNIATGWGWMIVIAAAAWAVFTALRELQRFWDVGLVGADRSVAHGINYGDSLRLVKTELSFLGTGAHKLSATSEFDDALRRCRPDVPIRLLLRRPDDPALAEAARRAGKPEHEYGENVVESLTKLARLQRSISNVEVRFYDGDMVFRIMIINRSTALVSFNVYGHGDGAELPQVHILEASEGRDAVRSFYYAYERYFNERWDRASVWDFRAYL